MAHGDDQSVSIDFDEEPGADERELPPPEGVFGALSNRRRIRLLSVLRSTESVDVEELTDILVGWEATTDGPAGPDEWTQCRVELIHSQLPLLSDVGLVDYDTGEGTVELASLPDPVEELLAFAGEYDSATSSLAGDPPTTD